MDNIMFLNLLSLTFKRFLETHARSNEKLKILHGGIARDIQNILGDSYNVLSLGIGSETEGLIEGRYIEKRVDITIKHNSNIVAGVGVKFVMNNYSQNSNNYFENMLGETANIKCNKIPYFQILIVPETMPYYNNNNIITKWETFTAHNAHKYKILSHDNSELTFHTPTKTLLFVAQIPQPPDSIETKEQYKVHYLSQKTINIKPTMNFDKNDFGSSVILNDYEGFIKRVYHYVKSL